jgi:hypothetical protein
MTREFRAEITVHTIPAARVKLFLRARRAQATPSILELFVNRLRRWSGAPLLPDRAEVPPNVSNVAELRHHRDRLGSAYFVESSASS